MIVLNKLIIIIIILIQVKFQLQKYKILFKIYLNQTKSKLF